VSSHPPPGTRFLSYIRFSSKPQERGQSVERQTALARRYADDYKLRLDTSTYSDLGVSAFRGLKAGSAMAALVAAVEAGKIPKGSVIGIEQLDRWSRAAPLDALNSFQRVLRKGVGIVTLTDRRYWTMDALKDLNGLLSAILTMSRSHEESAAKSERLKSAWASKRRRVAAGTVHTKMCPGWLSHDGKAWKVDARKAATVLRVFTLAAEGYGADYIARTLNRDRVPVPTRRGKSFHASTVFKLLNAPSVIGTLQVGHRDTPEDGASRRVIDQDVPGYFPAVVPKRLWLKTRRAARPKIATGPKRDGTKNLFATILQCGACRASLHFVDKGEGGVYLVCSNARRGLCKASRGWRYDRFEPLMISLLRGCIRWETLIPTAQAAHTSALAKLEENLASLEVERQTVAVGLKRIVDAIKAGVAIDSLTAEAKTLDARGRTLDGHAVDLRGRVEAERERLRGLREETKESKAAFTDWKSGGEVARHRLAVVLRRMLKAIVLTSTETGYGPARESRRLELVFRDPHEGPETFIISADLTEAYTVEGERLVTVETGQKGG
jgi:DNA invertase Pin-like site-specific DNA recombinase